MAGFRKGLAAAAIAAGMVSCAEAQRFDWDDIGQAFCQAALAEDLRGLGPILSPALRQMIEGAARNGDVPPRLLLQAYDAPAAGCTVRTRNAAIIEVRREPHGGAGWTDYLVMVPEADGSTRIDDILFATRRNDTLRERLRLVLGR
jgi:hypothetical protein